MRAKAFVAITHTWLLHSAAGGHKQVGKAGKRFGSHQGIGLRMMKLMRGGKCARREAELMVREKIDAALEATASLMAGASGDRIVRRYRKRVEGNAKRLSRLNSNQGQGRKPRRKNSSERPLTGISDRGLLCLACVWALHRGARDG